MYGCENGWPGAAQNYLGVLGAWPWSVFPAYLHTLAAKAYVQLKMKKVKEKGRRKPCVESW